MSANVSSKAENQPPVPTLPSDSEQNTILVWMDLEMSGLDLRKDHILEIAVILTDFTPSLAQIAPSAELHMIVKHPKSLMDSMDEWCTRHHGESGLTRQVLKSVLTMREAEQRILDFLAQHKVDAKRGFLAGNSVHVDRQFIMKDLPRVSDYLHYRIVDVSTVKEICRNWYPNEFEKQPQKKMSHRALDDIRESIRELCYYRSTIFN